MNRPSALNSFLLAMVLALSLISLLLGLSCLALDRETSALREELGRLTVEADYNRRYREVLIDELLQDSAGSVYRARYAANYIAQELTTEESILERVKLYWLYYLTGRMTFSDFHEHVELESILYQGSLEGLIEESLKSLAKDRTFRGWPAPGVEDRVATALHEAGIGEERASQIGNVLADKYGEFGGPMTRDGTPIER